MAPVGRVKVVAARQGQAAAAVMGLAMADMAVVLG